MWHKPWQYKEGLTIGAGLFVTGVLLQLSIDRIDWGMLHAPVNIIIGIFFLLLLVAMHLTRKQVYLFGWLSSYRSAVSSLVWVGSITLVMGFVKQVPSGHRAADPFGFTQMITSWPFTLLYVWMVFSLGLATLRVGFPRRWSRLPFFLTHEGLMIALVAAVLGNADMQRLRMTCKTGQAEWRAENERGQLVELPLAIELKSFRIEEYAPNLCSSTTKAVKLYPKNAPNIFCWKTA